MDFLTRAAQGVLVFDGAMGTQLHERNPAEADYAGLSGCSEILCETRPDMIRDIHDAYFKAGADVVETNSFGSNEIVLAEYGIAHRARELSTMAASIARQAADAWSRPSKPRFVAGSIGPGTKLISLRQTDWATMHHSYLEQCLGLLAGGVDLFLIETCQDLLQIKCAICAAQDACAALGRTVPIIVTVTVETTGSLLVGSDIPAVVTSLQPLGIYALGMNCATGPADMKPFVSELARLWRGPILIQPNAGLPQNINGQLQYNLSVSDFVNTVAGFVKEDGVSMVGGCCGTHPAFTAALVADVAPLQPAVRRNEAVPSVASIFSAQALSQNPAPFFIGERTNTNGSKVFRDALLKDDWDGLVDIAREQVSNGVHGLDLCVAFTGRDEIRDMSEALARMVTQIDLPLVIDSTEFPVLEQALQMYGGRAIINSINLEDGEGRADKICTLAKRYGAALIALTIDEKGMARSIDEKVAVAKRLYDIVVNRHGLAAESLIFDPLTFTLGSGDETLRDSAMNTIEGIRRIKTELPGVLTVLGLSNVSFGLHPAARRVLNSVFLHECVQAGLDMAIVNLKHIVPLQSVATEDSEAAYRLLKNEWVERGGEKQDPLFAFIRHFEGRSKDEASDAVVDESVLTLSERIASRVVKGSRGQLKELLEAAIGVGELAGGPNVVAGATAGARALLVINNILIPAMKTVGELFGSGKMQLPFVLQSAEVMKTAVGLLEPYMEKTSAQDQTAIVLATVRGDVHDIGKNLVEIILSNNGYKVHNLGIKVEVGEMIQKLRDTKAHALGMSGLLVKSTMIMKENLEELKRQDIKVPVLLGGAALTPSYVSDVCAPLAPDACMYCADAFEGLRAMNLIKEGRLAEYLEVQAQKRKARVLPVVAKPEEESPVVVRRDVAIPKAPFLGVRQIHDVDLDEVYAFLTEEVLFRGRWGYRRGSLDKAAYEDLIEKQVRPEFEALKADAAKRKLLVPKVSYGYFECNSQGDEVLVYKPGTREIAGTFSFPRQVTGAKQCIADYFLPADSGRADLIALQVCTVGQAAQDESQRLYDANAYKDYLLFHGLSVECAEALAEFWHRKIRLELGIAGDDGAGILDFVVQKYQGSRYSFGYPACPDLEQNRLLCALLESESIGVRVSEEEQMVPEQTTSAFVVHHPQAKYFNA